jgi:hypothetical protein
MSDKFVKSVSSKTETNPQQAEKEKTNDIKVIKDQTHCIFNPLADGAKGRARVLIPPGYLHPGV